MTALNRTVAFGTEEDDGFPDSSLNDNGPAPAPLVITEPTDGATVDSDQAVKGTAEPGADISLMVYSDVDESGPYDTTADDGGEWEFSGHGSLLAGHTSVFEVADGVHVATVMVHVPEGR